MRLIRSAIYASSQIVILFSFWCAPVTANPVLDDMFALARICRGDKPSVKQINDCLDLLRSGTDAAQKQASAVHFYVAGNYAWLKDYSMATYHARLAIENYSEMALDKVPPKDRDWVVRAHFARKSYLFESLGVYQELNAMKTNLERGDGLPFARVALSSYSTAIGISERNHSAIAKRAGLLAKMCRQDEAETDLKRAIRIAQRHSDKAAVEEYQNRSLPTCWREFKE